MEPKAEFGNDYLNILADRVREGDTDEALGKLIYSLKTEMRCRIYHVTDIYPWINKQDLESLYVEAIWQTCRTFNRERGNFAWYIHAAWKRITRGYIRHHAMQKRAGAMFPVPLNHAVDVAYHEDFDSGMERQEAAATVVKLMNAIDEQQAKICRLVMNGHSHRQIARRLNLPNAMTVTRTLQKIRRQLAEIGVQ
ncbi:ECF-type sigma factor [Kyrpidia sp.]|uniref:ECF-type sigma factor n=1 Tax=Kyrpidia sp. TaxID=2073077 RepID=UPI002586D974|nr:ECF-type sigma factor [Kyrpidia sp.]MCL6575550.1 hypothetical protein [Kyrpidia sp.]